MDFFTVALCIVAVVMLSNVLLTYIKTKHQRTHSDELEQRLYALENRDQSDLEERVANLERIVTDKRSTLKDEIDSL